MKLTSILGALDAVLLALAGGGAETRNAGVAHAPTSGIRRFNPQPPPPG
jgi:hypothetical protein